MRPLLVVIIGLVVVGMLVGTIIVLCALVLGARADHAISNQDKERTDA